MQFPITIGLHRSSFLGRALLLVHAVALGTVLGVPWPPALQGAVAVGLGLSAWVGWRRCAPPVSTLRLLADGRLEVQAASRAPVVAADLAPYAVVHPWLTVLRLRVEGRGLTLIVVADSLLPDDFRRLRVWLRWRADFSGAASDA